MINDVMAMSETTQLGDERGLLLKVFPGTVLDIPILFFLVSGFIGVLAAYDERESVPKLLMIMGAVVVYFGIVALRGMPRWLELAVWTYLAGGAGAAVYFMAQTDFSATPTKSEFLTRVGVGLNTLLPHVTNTAPHPNLAAGALEIVLPFGLLMIIHFLQEGAWVKGTAAAILVSVIGLGLALTTSRGAWLAIGSVGVGILVVRGAILVLQHTGTRVRRSWLLAGIGFGILMGGAALWAWQGQAAYFLDAWGVSRAALPRLTLYRETWELIQEYLFTGAGLGGFPLVYSAYVRLIDAPFYVHAHNIFLEIWIEQGLMGISALAWLLIAFAWWGWRTRREWNWLTTAGFAAAGILLVHGLVDNPIYGSHALPFLFAPFAFAIASIAKDGRANATQQGARAIRLTRKTAGVVGIAILVLAGLVFVTWRPLEAMWFANLGAVIESKVELSRYRPDKPILEIHSITETRRVETGELAPAHEMFTRALTLDPLDVVALRRLGLIALARRDMNEAVRDLDAAWRISPDNRATRKGLGLALAWTGKAERAQLLLESLEEIHVELSDDTWWWRWEGRDDLADASQVVLERMNAVKDTRGQ